jgi:hypothetical protein
MSLAEDWLQRFLTSQVNPRPIALVRIIVGLAATASGLEILFLLPRALDPSFLQLPLLPLLPRLPQSMDPGFVALWMVCGLLVSAGLAARPAALILIALISYLLLLDQQLYSNHHYLLLLELLFLALAQSDATWSVVARQRGQAPHSIPGWPILLLQFQISAVYLFSALSKINPAFLTGSVLSSVVAIPLPLPPVVLAILTILAEAYLAFALWQRRLRLSAMLIGLGLHSSIVVSMGAASAFEAYQLAVFSCLICAPYLLFLWNKRLV